MIAQSCARWARARLRAHPPSRANSRRRGCRATASDVLTGRLLTVPGPYAATGCAPSCVNHSHRHRGAAPAAVATPRTSHARHTAVRRRREVGRGLLVHEDTGGCPATNPTTCPERRRRRRRSSFPHRQGALNITAERHSARRVGCALERRRRVVLLGDLHPPTRPPPGEHQRPTSAPQSSDTPNRLRNAAYAHDLGHARPTHTHQPSGHPTPTADPTNPSVDPGLDLGEAGQLQQVAGCPE